RVSSAEASKCSESLALNHPTVRYRTSASSPAGTATSASSRAIDPNSPRLPFSPVSFFLTFGEEPEAFRTLGAVPDPFPDFGGDPAPLRVFVPAPAPMRPRSVMVLIRPSHSTRTHEGKWAGPHGPVMSSGLAACGRADRSWQR